MSIAGRNVRISLTSKGTKVVPKVLDAWAAVENHAVDGLSSQQQSQPLELLRTVIDNYEFQSSEHESRES